MNREQAKILASVIEAFGNDKAVEWRYKGTKQWHIGNDSLSFNENGVEYRIKPEPLVLYAHQYNDGTIGGAYKGIDLIVKNQHEPDNDLNIIKFVQEVDC